MGKSLTEITKEIKDSNKKVQLIYAFNGTGKTRLSSEFKNLIDLEVEDVDFTVQRILYYNAFTEDLFYWDNDLEYNQDRKLKIHSNSFTKWIFEDQGKDADIIKSFQNYTSEKLTPHFNPEYKNSKETTIPAFSEITFSYERGNEEDLSNIKISKGEESCLIWCIFNELLEEVINVLNILEPEDRETSQFDSLKYVFIDDPVSSLDDNHVIELAVNLAALITSSDVTNGLKFIITTHNPLFYNVLHCEFDKAAKYFLKKEDENNYIL